MHYPTLFRLCVTTMILGCLLQVFPPSSVTAKPTTFVPGRLVYAIQDWSAQDTNPETMKATLQVNYPVHQVAEYYWGVQFVFDQGNTGWFGMTSSCMGVGGKGFVFTICDGLIADPPLEGYVSTLIEPGNGLSCILPYPWINGTPYTLTLSLSSYHGENTNHWELHVYEQETGKTIHVGTIQTNKKWTHLYKWSTAFVEYFGPLQDCQFMPYGSVLINPLVVGDSVSLPVQEIWKTESCTSYTETKNQGDATYIKTGSKY